MIRRDSLGKFVKGNAYWLGKKGIKKANSGSFKKGSVPWNKNKRGEYKMNVNRLGKCLNTGKTHFKKGSLNPNWKGGKAYDKDGYLKINKNGKYVRYHVWLMEQLIGRKLKENECVHHINKDILDNRLDNLKLMTKSEHSRLHFLLKNASKI